MAFYSSYFSKKFNTMFEQYLLAYPNRRTKEEKKNTILAFCEFCKKDFLQITHKDVKRYFGMMEKKIADGKLRPSTYQSRKSTLVTMAKFVYDRDSSYELVSFFTDTSIYKVTRNIMPSKIPSLKEVDLFLEQAKEKPQFFVILTLVFRISLTASEVTTLQMKNVREMDGEYIIHLPAINQKKERIMLLPPDVADILLTYMKSPYLAERMDEEGHLFYNSHGHVMTLRNLDSAVKDIIKASGIEESYTLKDLRSRAILDMIYAASATKDSAEQTRKYYAIADYAGIRDLRLNSYVRAAHLVHECPASFTNLQVINPLVDSGEED